MKKTYTTLVLLSTLAFSNANAVTVTTTVSDFEVSALADGSFAIVNEVLPPAPVGGVQCSKWHFVRNGQAGVSTVDAVDKMFSIALAAKYSGRDLSVTIDVPATSNSNTPNGNSTCFVGRLKAK